jgi:hypothetical protein
VRDPFYLDLEQLPSVIEGLQHGQAVSYDEWAPESARNSFEGAHVSAVVLEIDGDDPELRRGRQIAVWSTTALATDAGGWRRTNRSAIPMMWPLFRAVGADDDSDRYLAATTAHPADDRADDGDRVRDIIRAAARHAGTERAHDHADLVTSRLLPDVLPYRVGTPAAFSFAGFNGRALADNAPEVMYSLITNSAVPTGLTSAVAAGARAGSFPYVVPAT